jgi:hypothetical protein
MKWCFFSLEYIFLSFLLLPKDIFAGMAKMDALYVRPKGEGQGCPESKLAPFHSAQTDATVPPDFPALTHRGQGGTTSKHLD